MGAPQGGLTAVWQVPWLAGVMRCSGRIQIQQSRASGAIHLSGYGRVLWSVGVPGVPMGVPEASLGGPGVCPGVPRTGLRAGPGDPRFLFTG